MANTEVDLDQLISLVEERPVLWDKRNSLYKDKNAKAEAWREICGVIYPSILTLDLTERSRLGKLLGFYKKKL